ncbi:hypothetical protein [Desulfonatronospira thiodismutans]|nr:hypothetical protein [Desulfonatronospira thiodismutans]
MQSKQPKKPCIVVVNDDSIQMGTLKVILERGGYAVKAHSSA